MNRVAFSHHYPKALVEVPIKLFKQHWIVVIAQQNMTIYFEQVQGFVTDAKEFAALV
jgi:hypothetical protein